MSNLNPVLLTEAATRKLSRRLLLRMIVAFIVAGLVWRDPWRAQDAIGFGAAWSLAYGGLADFLMPNVLGAPLPQEGPLLAWLGAGFIRSFFFLPAHQATFLLTFFALMLAAATLWYGTYYLAKTPSAQPLALAFGGQPKPANYGRAVADGAILVWLACLGAALRLHELSSEMLQFSLHAFLLFAAVWLLYQPRRALVLIALAFTALTLTRGAAASLPNLIWLGVLLAHPARRAQRLSALAVALLSFGLSFLMLYAMPSLRQGEAYQAAWLDWQLQAFALPSLDKLSFLFANIGVFAWPAVPFAVAALIRWRRHLRTPHIWLPATHLAVMLITLIFLNERAEATMLLVLPAAVMLAAFMLPALPRGVMNAVDWFGLWVLGFAILLIWLAWLAVQTGYPTGLYKLVTLRYAPGYEPSFNLIAFAAALGATAFWVMVVVWRLRSQPTVIWRAAIIWSAGGLSAWVLLSSLWMPLINHKKTYRDVGLQISQALPRGYGCVNTQGLGLAQRASFAYFGHITFAPTPLSKSPAHELDESLNSAALKPSNTKGSLNCTWLLVQDAPEVLAGLERPPALPAGSWQLKWQGRRLADTNERFRLYQRAQ